MLSLGALGAPAIASEFDILGEPTPTSNYFIDDASVLSKATRQDINKRLKLLEVRQHMWPIARTERFSATLSGLTFLLGR